MPELPEVETIRRDLASVLKGQRISDLIVKQSTLLHNPLALFRRYLVGAKILSVKRRAKLLLFELSSGYWLVVHLKMTGQLVWRPKRGRWRVGGHPIGGVSEVPNKYTYITLKTPHGSLYFNDVRKFGYWQLIPKSNLSHYLQAYGPEPLSVKFKWRNLAERLLSHKRLTIKAALLNQTVVAGLGNIYTDESLFVARLNPKRLVASLKPVELKRLCRAIVMVLKKALSARGTSFNTYVDSLGQRGHYWQQRFVYGRRGELCRRCQRPIKKMILAGRGTHYCAFCQS